jgi:hypothetical protein
MIDGNPHSVSPAPLSNRRIVRTWWPLAVSWMLMGLEGPAISVVVARLVDPEINLAAFGGLVFPLSLLIEAPIIMLLAASTALCRDWESYRNMRSFTHKLSAALTLLHALMVFTPLYELIAVHVIRAPAAIIEPGRIGLIIMLPWTWSIAYRRFNQGVLIRFGHSLSVGAGTAIRLGADALVLLAGFLVGSIPGVVVASATVIAGVVSEAVYVGLRIRPVLRNQVRLATPLKTPLTFRAFLDFYVPLSLTSVILFAASPILSAGVSRMPAALESLALWPVVTGVLFLVRSLGISLNEVVVALLDRPLAYARLKRFTTGLCAATTVALLLCLIPSLGMMYFQRITGLSESLATVARYSLWFALPMPAMSVLQSWYQGMVLHSRHTRSITESVLIYLLGSSAVLLAGVLWGGAKGIYVGVAAVSVGEVVRTAWLRWRGGPARRSLSGAEGRP